MPEADDRRELSGLARSIDALFSGTSGEEPATDAREAPPAVRPDPLDDAPYLRGVEPVDLPPVEPPGPSSAEPEAPSHATPRYPTLAAHQGPPVTAPETLPVAELRAPAAGDWGDPLDLGSGTEARRGELVEPPPGPPRLDGTAETEPLTDPHDLQRAVDAFLSGVAGAEAEIEDVASELRDRLALDPLADAVERLASDGDDSPDSAPVDLALSIMNPAVGSRIVQRIGHERDDARKSEYTTVCRRLGGIMAKALRGALTDTTRPEARRAYHEMLIAMGDVGRPIIEEMVDDENGLLVTSAVAMLGEMGGRRAVELVTSTLANPDARVRREALQALARLGDEEAGALVLGSMEDPDPEVRLAAATAAGELKLDRALRPLLAMLEAEQEEDRLLPLIRALGQLGDPGAVPAIEKRAVRTVFSKPPAEVRVEAYRALHEIGTPHARELVEKALSDKEVGVRAAVRRIVGPAA